MRDLKKGIKVLYSYTSINYIKEELRLSRCAFSCMFIFNQVLPDTNKANDDIKNNRKAKEAHYPMHNSYARY